MRQCKTNVWGFYSILLIWLVYAFPSPVPANDANPVCKANKILARLHSRMSYAEGYIPIWKDFFNGWVKKLDKIAFYYDYKLKRAGGDYKWWR